MFSTILAKIHLLMLDNGIERMQADPGLVAGFERRGKRGVYRLPIIGIIGYFTIPTEKGAISIAGGMGS